jgi:hypothetical protein
MHHLSTAQHNQALRAGDRLGPVRDDDAADVARRDRLVDGPSSTMSSALVASSITSTFASLSRVVACPSPRPPPVTMATLPSNDAVFIPGSSHVLSRLATDQGQLSAI